MIGLGRGDGQLSFSYTKPLDSGFLFWVEFKHVPKLVSSWLSVNSEIYLATLLF